MTYRRFTPTHVLTAEDWNSLIDEVETLRKEVDRLKSEKEQLLKNKELKNARIRGMAKRIEAQP